MRCELKQKNCTKIKQNCCFKSSVLTVPLYCEQGAVVLRSPVEKVYDSFWLTAKSSAYHGYAVTVNSVGQSLSGFSIEI